MCRRLLLALVLTTFVALHATADEERWFDLDKCSFCKEIQKQQGLVQHMRTEYHDVKSGIMSVTYIDKDYEPAFAKAQEGMKPVVADIMAGKEVPMCKHCSTLGSFYGMGVMPETVKSAKCIIVIYNSTDAETVEKLKSFAKKSNEALTAIYKKQDAKEGAKN